MKLRIPLLLLSFGLLAFLALSNAGASFAESTGPRLFASVVNDPTYGSVAWSNPSGAMTCDDVRAETTVNAGTISQWLKATNANLAVPIGATITSIDIIIEAEVSGRVGDLNGLRVMLLKGGTPIVLQGIDLVTSATDVTYTAVIPSPWAQSWTPVDVNASDFGAQVYAHTTGEITVRIDCLSTNVHYLYSPTQQLHLPVVSRQQAGSTQN